MCWWCKYEDVKTQTTKGICFGFGGCELPGYRVVQKCKKCGHIRYLSLNIAMPDKYLYQESIWRD